MAFGEILLKFKVHLSKKIFMNCRIWVISVLIEIKFGFVYWFSSTTCDNEPDI